jgi:hypothetical protein
MTSPVLGQENSDPLVDFVRELPRGVLEIPYQWLEMETVIGWEKMMLVYGYADNRTVCLSLVTIAKNDSPFREFRCSDAN